MKTKPCIKRGALVTYRPRHLDFDVSAIVRRVHRDGTATVEARHWLDENGKPDGCYLGYCYRIPQEMVVRQ